MFLLAKKIMPGANKNPNKSCFRKKRELFSQTEWALNAGFSIYQGSTQRSTVADSHFRPLVAAFRLMMAHF